MFGTGEDILRAASHYGRFMDLLDLSAQGGKRLRRLLNSGIGEETMEKYLVSIGAKKIRDKIVVPAVIKDKKGRLFTETTFLFYVERELMLKDLNLNLVCSNVRRGLQPNEQIVREIMRRKKAYYFAKRVTLPSLWELEVDWREKHR